MVRLMTVAEKPTPRRVLDLAGQLTHRQLEQIWPKLHHLRVQKTPGVLSPRETEILKGLNAPAPAAKVDRFRKLTAKRDDKGLSSAEQREMERLVDVFDTLDLERAGLLAELARLRGVPGSTLIQSLGLPRTEYV